MASKIVNKKLIVSINPASVKLNVAHATSNKFLDIMLSNYRITLCVVVTSGHSKRRVSHTHLTIRVTNLYDFFSFILISFLLFQAGIHLL